MHSTNDLSQLADGELWQQMSQGEEAAFVALYRRYQRGVYRFAYRMSGSSELAEDVTQEVFLALLRTGERYDATRSSLSSYLFGITRNLVLQKLERERRWLPLPETAELDENAFLWLARENPLGNLTQQELIETVQRAVLALPPHYREVVVLCDLHELSYAETAAVLDCAIGTVRSRLNCGRAILSEKLSEKLGHKLNVARPARMEAPQSATDKQEFGVLYEMPGL